MMPPMELIEALPYFGIAILLGATGGYALGMAGLRFRIPVTWNDDNTD